MVISILKTKNASILTLLLTLFLIVGNTFSQSGTSGINGTVSDQNSAPVAGATIKITNSGTGFTRSSTTDSDGNYQFPGIPPGIYKVDVENSGFKKSSISNARASVDLPLRLNITLETGNVSAIVDVRADDITSIANTQDATLGVNFSNNQIQQLPTDSRKINDLLSLQPSVTREGYVAGARSDQSNITLDGIDVNDQQTGGRTGQFQTTQNSALRITSEAVEEFRIVTTNANPSQGRSSGAQISLLTKGGTNNIRGSAFYFLKPTRGSANDFFNNQAGIARPIIRRDIYGGTIGGPIKKDKLFFFYSYEGQRENITTPVTQTVPLASLGRGELKFFGSAPGDPAGTNRLITLSTAQLNGIYSLAGINPIAVSALASASSRYVANDLSSGDPNTGTFRFNAPTTDPENTHIAKFDYNLSDTQSVYFRANYQAETKLLNSAYPDTAATTLWDHPIGFAVGHNWTLSNTLINNFRYGFTRQAFSNQGDSSANAISFRFVYSPANFSRTSSRITPTQNFTDDLTWIKGNHTIQVGTNIRVVRNTRTTFASAFDSAVINPSFYQGSGSSVIAPITAAGYTVSGGSNSSTQAAASALIGRYSQYAANFTFNLDGSVAPSGSATKRTFATEEYDFYGQDSWKVFRNVTLTYGLRYGLSRPVYEKNGFQVLPDTALGDVLARRIASAERGLPDNTLVQFIKGGPKNDGPGFYKLDKNNFQPRVAIAWSPNLGDGFWGKLIGNNDKATIRGGFAVTNDHFGQQLAVSFDALSTIGFTSSSSISANRYNVTTALGPLFTGFGQSVRSLPNLLPAVQRFNTPADQAERIETSLDSSIISPTHYTWNVSYGRQLGAGFYAEASYVGRKAKNLLATRDVLAFNNLKDPISGQDWYTAAGILHDLRARNTPIASVQQLPFFANLFPSLAGNGLSATQAVYELVARPAVGGFDILDWTFVQTLIDDSGIRPNMFVHPQYAAFSAFSSVANSNYQGLAFTVRQRLSKTISWDLNYTLSNSKDDASGLQTSGSYGGQFILNALRQSDNYSFSDFDTRHVVNGNVLFDLPFGRGRSFFNGVGSFANAFIGGWSMTSIFRWNSGLPISVPFDSAQWATNWNVQSNGTRIRPVVIANSRNTQNVFANPQAAYNSFRNAKPGETGERNTLRVPGYSVIDLGLGKAFDMPWGENHKFEFRFQVFNVANFQPLTDGGQTRTTFGLQQDSDVSSSVASTSFGKILTGIQGSPRNVQFGFRYSF